ncbi:uncharacterized protein LOC131236933 [Magnolia sinica]|uniref:uncharacterized protein LOC131236933 n=1 Tax=Magnolia sinica TaxID=86752 RepID=UPI0026582474|nr:uncharacterized protein LOC131236933 [Magnolia sinica]
MDSKEMDISSDLDEPIHDSIQHSAGLLVSSKTLQSKLLISEEVCHRLQDQIFLLQDQLKEKEERIKRSRAEASLSAQALRKYANENHRLAAECGELSRQCTRWGEECLLYDRDREALMEFGNDVDEQAKDAEVRALEAEDESRRLVEEIKYYKHEWEMLMIHEVRVTEELGAFKQRIDELEHKRLHLQGCNDGHLASCQCSSLKKENQELQLQLLSSIHGNESKTVEGHFLESMISSMLAKADITRHVKDEVAAIGRSFLGTEAGVESCQRLLRLWESLKPTTKNILALVAEVGSLRKDKEHLRINLQRAEEEA